jgi:hypothetical protein
MNRSRPVNHGRRYVIALAEDADDAIGVDGTHVIERTPGIVLIEVETAIAAKLAREGQHVAVFAFLDDASRAFASLHST